MAAFAGSSVSLTSPSCFTQTRIDKQGSSLVTESSPSRGGLPMEGLLEDMQSRIRRLERWQAINTVLWTFLMSALVGYSFYQRKRQ